MIYRFKVLVVLSLTVALTVNSGPESSAAPAQVEIRPESVATDDSLEAFDIDRSHSYLEFAVEFMGLNEVRGTFGWYDAAIVYDENPVNMSVTFVIDVSSIDTRSGFRDRDLRGEDFFHTEKHPYAIFQSDRIERAEDGFIAHGHLRMRGVTREFSVPFRYTVPRMRDELWGNLRIGFEGTFSLNRSDFGITGGNSLRSSLIADTVDVEFAMLGSRFNYDRFGFDSTDKPSVGEKLLEVALSESAARALEEYDRLRENDPDEYNFDPGQLRVAGLKLFERDDFVGALAFFRKVRALGAYEGSMALMIAESHMRMKEPDHAIAFYREALESDPVDPTALEMLRRLNAPVDLDRQLERATARSKEESTG